MGVNKKSGTAFLLLLLSCHLLLKSSASLPALPGNDIKTTKRNAQSRIDNVFAADSLSASSFISRRTKEPRERDIPQYADGLPTKQGFMKSRQCYEKNAGSTEGSI